MNIMNDHWPTQDFVKTLGRKLQITFLPKGTAALAVEDSDSGFFSLVVCFSFGEDEAFQAFHSECWPRAIRFGALSNNYVVAPSEAVFMLCKTGTHRHGACENKKLIIS